MLKGKNILLISPEAWDHIFVSKHHYAVHLSRAGNTVFFLNPPGTTSSITKSGFENLTIVNYTGFVRGLRFLPRVCQRLLMRLVWKSIERKIAVKLDVVWSFDNSVFYDFSIFPKSVITISHIVDLNQNYNTGTAAQTAAICFCTTDLIRERLAVHNRRVFKINHGFNDIQCEVDVRLPGDNPSKAIYSGNLKMPFIDWEILFLIAKRMPNVDFLFIGPGFHDDSDVSPLTQSKRRLALLPNVYDLGRIPSEHIGAHLKHADILLVCYQEKHHADQANPHKMMEYLGSGKMIVASHTSEYLGLSQQDLILMSRANADFPKIFQQAVERLTHWNSPVLQEARKSFAMRHTYQRQIEKIQQVIGAAL